VRLGSEKDRALLTMIVKFEKMNDKNKKQVVEWCKDILQKVGFFRVRFAHTAPPILRPKMGFAIFRLCPPTTLIQANSNKTDDL
jgi:hypothetical protein